MSVGLLLKIKTLVISTIFNNILTRSRFHFKKPLYLLILMKLVLSQVLSWNCSNSATSSYSTSNSCSLIISTASIVISFTSHESVKLIHESWNHFQTAVNVNILTSFLNHECSSWHLQWWILFRSFSIYFARIHQRSHSLWQLQPYEVYFLPTTFCAWDFWK